MSANLAARRVEATRRESFTAPGAGPARRRRIAALTRARLTDAWLDATGGRAPEGLALAAVGSLAREESGPLSDLDLVLLHDGRHEETAVAELAQRLWYPLWDGGLRLDHSVRTPGECRAIAGQDLAALAGLLDLKPIAGDASLVAGAAASVARDWRAEARRRLPDLVAEVGARHERHGDLAHLLEPDLKEARGGLRDLSIMRALVAAWLADRPHGAVDEAAQTLLDIRDALHLASGRGRERLHRQDRDAVAALVGLPDGDALLARVSDAARVVALAVERTLRRAGQAQGARTLRVGPRRPHLRPLGHGVYEHEGEVVLGADALARAGAPGGDPLLPLRVARAATLAGLPVAPTTVATLATQPAPALPWPDVPRSLFVDLLASGEALPGVWEAATVAGIVEAWLPAWSAVRSRPQHNPVHRHTVDRHSVEVVVEASAYLDRVARPDLLLVAALLHDIGKAGGGEEHARIGAPVAREAAAGLGYAGRDLDVVELLVAEHLTLVGLATRRDTTDPATVTALLDAVGGDPDVLDLLDALTRADARSVGERSWNTWRARLVDDLVGRARARLADGPAGRGAPAAERASAAAEGAAVEVLPPVPVTTAEADQARAGRPVVRCLPAGEGAAVVEVVALDRVGLFADVAAALARQRASVRRAVLATVDGLALDRWDVDLDEYRGFDPEAAVRDIGNPRPARPSSGRPSTETAAEAQAFVIPGASADATVVELRAADRPGLLRDAGAALAEVGVSIRSAHVETYAGRCRDAFYLVEPGGAGLSPTRVAEVLRALLEAV